MKWGSCTKECCSSLWQETRRILHPAETTNRIYEIDKIRIIYIYRELTRTSGSPSFSLEEKYSGIANGLKWLRTCTHTHPPPSPLGFIFFFLPSDSPHESWLCIDLEDRVPPIHSSVPCCPSHLFGLSLKSWELLTWELTELWYMSTVCHWKTCLGNGLENVSL